jgi:hypothetical protein
MASDRKVIATTVVHRDGFYRTAFLRTDGSISEWAQEGSGGYRTEEREAIALADKWGVYYVPNQYAADMDRVEEIMATLRKYQHGSYHMAVESIRSRFPTGTPRSRAAIEAFGHHPGPQDGGVVIPPR